MLRATEFLDQTRWRTFLRPVARGVAALIVSTFLAACAAQHVESGRAEPRNAVNRAYAAEMRPDQKPTASGQDGLYFKTVPVPDIGAPATTPFLAEFKHWPPRHPSARYIYPDSFMLPYRGLTSAELLSTLERTLLNLGYPDVFYFSTKNGLAMAIPFERIDDEGRPLKERRFEVEANLGALSVSEANKQMFRGYAARYRAIVFIVTTDKSRSDRVPGSFAKQRQFLGSGAKAVDDGIATTIITPGHQLTAYIYVWTVAKEETPIYLHDDFHTYGIDHLRHSGIPTGADQ